MAINNDVFRFVSLRSVQRANESTLKGKVFKAYSSSDQETQFFKQLLESRKNNRANQMVELVTRFITSEDAFVHEEFVSDISMLETPLVQLNNWLLSLNNRPSLAELSAYIKRITDQEPDKLVHSANYQKDRRRVGNSLLALTIVPLDKNQLRDDLLHTVYLFGLIEQLAISPEDIKTAEDIHRVLNNGIVVLPREIFPIPEVNRMVPQDLDTAEEVTLSPQIAKELKMQDVITAIDEIRRVFNSYNRSNSDGDEFSSSVKLPVMGGESDFRLEETIGAMQPERIPDGLDVWALPNGFLNEFKTSTRRIIEENSSPGSFINVPEVINQLENKLAIIGSSLSTAKSLPSYSIMGSQYVNPQNFILIPDKLIPFTDDKLLWERLGLSRKPGIAELKVVRQKLLRYEMGEIAHIENVLKGESKQRVHRKASTTEETLTTETEQFEESERDQQSTERFELQKEAAVTTHEDSHLETGVTITANYGVSVSVTGNLGYTSNNSKDESSRKASNYARDVTERSVTRIQERIRQQRVVRTRVEVEETNTHGLDNKEGTEHIVGIYRWVDKLYEAQVFNYGQRLLVELTVAEPAAFYLHAFANQAPQGVTLQNPEMPIDPVHKEILSPQMINNPIPYTFWVQKYHVANVNPPPKRYTTASVAWEQPMQEGRGANAVFKANKDIKIEEGYKAKKFVAQLFQLRPGSSSTIPSFVAIGGSWVAFGAFAANWHLGLLADQEGNLPVALFIPEGFGYTLTVEVLCERTDEAFGKWQLETYEAIMRAYFELKSQYNEQVAALATQQGVAIEGRNPLQNRMIEKTELKKSALTMLNNGNYPFEMFGSINQLPPYNFPEMDISRARTVGPVIQFFEQLIEWSQMTYIFYPYFWSRKKNWIATSQLSDPDPIFAGFLSAGAARLILPVRQGFEQAIAHFLGTGLIWNGEKIPQVDHPLYISLVQELQEQQEIDPKGVPDGDPWEIRLPTTLAILQEGGKLPTF